MKKINLGDEVKDKLSDLEGTVTSICTYLYGCTQCGVQQKKLYDGILPDAIYIDEPQLELIKDNNKKESEPRYGGVRKHP